ncbi:MAG: iron-containing alcohol dehydrogenase [Armatimonadetes bacterium]|nr:iron-containing alcohol dehydrogenase [Armatimonadota bacterium]
MNNFTYRNPVELVFGKGTIAELRRLVPQGDKVLFAYGGGSIKKNGVYDQVRAALEGRDVLEFAGIEPNPRYETCMKAVDLCRREGVGFLLAVGGGSVLDAVKFIAAAVPFQGEPWDILAKHARVEAALPLGSVLTLPATGSEMNGNSVISRDETREKLAFYSPLVYPKFSILDPETTFTLPPRQTANGVVDAFAHTMEQYMTYPADAPLQDRMAEAILSTLIEIGPKLLEHPHDYQLRANMMWTATMALNGLIGLGVPQDWATHGIGHELTALYGMDHGQTLAVVMPAVWRFKFADKKAKLAQYAERVWGVAGTEEEKAKAAIEKTEEFFRLLGVKTRLAEYGAENAVEQVPPRLAQRGVVLGERRDIGPDQVREILRLCAA